MLLATITAQIIDSQIIRQNKDDIRLLGSSVANHYQQQDHDEPQ
jgi:hypothetical protein